MAPTRRAALVAGIVVLAMAMLPFVRDEYSAVLMTDIVIAALFAASLQFLLATGGMTSFGHAAYFGVGAYAAALAVRAGLPMLAAVAIAPLAAGIAAIVFGWFCVRLAGVYMAMLTLAFAQIVWSIAFQWESVTGGSNGIVGIWPATWLASRTAFFYFALAVVAIAAFVLIRDHAFAFRPGAARRARLATARSRARHQCRGECAGAHLRWPAFSPE